ncbi:hypothetical protein RJT34_06133 [Clitoria ternatea]|uniref:Uncharacterized protein n=1 Tax=Clitoria ternatea TaxID=43366 RepID=A0AAN9K3V8_CLITE
MTSVHDVSSEFVPACLLPASRGLGFVLWCVLLASLLFPGSSHSRPFVLFAAGAVLNPQPRSHASGESSPD